MQRNLPLFLVLALVLILGVGFLSPLFSTKPTPSPQPISPTTIPSPETVSPTPKPSTLNYPVPSTWKKYSCFTGTIHWEFYYPSDLSADLCGPSENVHLFTQNTGPFYITMYPWNDYYSLKYSGQSRRQYFLDSLKIAYAATPSCQFITSQTSFKELTFKNGSSFLQVYRALCRELDQEPINGMPKEYFAVQNSIPFMVTDNNYLSQTTVYTILQSLKVY